MRQFELTRREMEAMCPGLVRAYDTDLDPTSDVTWFLAAAVLPGCEAIPMEVEVDPEAILLWMERSLALQARGYAPGRPGRTRAIRGHVPVPARVAALVHMLACHEIRHDPDPATFGPRFAARWADPSRDPRPGHGHGHRFDHRHPGAERHDAPVPRPAAPAPPAPRPSW